MSLEKLNNAEAISALMDNELSDFEIRRLLQSLPESPETSAQLSRFYHAQAVMHNELSTTVSPNFANNIMAALEDEPVYSSHQSEPRTSLAATLLTGMGKFAVAASVAAAAFISMQSYLATSTAGTGGDAPLAQNDSAVSTQPSTEYPRMLAGSETATFDAEAQQRLNEYIRSVSIQNREQAGEAPRFNVLQDSQLIRQVNQIEQ
ncbi:MAG: sigma-E factor negative regulatory protein [Pseudohongiellaceae bacterium]|nr:sigma-E factor negative regulatory protein [Pseudohongiellaceae bacterium]